MLPNSQTRDGKPAAKFENASSAFLSKNTLAVLKSYLWNEAVQLLRELPQALCGRQRSAGKKKKKKESIDYKLLTKVEQHVVELQLFFHIKTYLFNIKDMHRQNWACFWTHTFIFDSVHTHINASEHHDTTHLFSSVKLSLPLVSG